MTTISTMVRKNLFMQRGSALFPSPAPWNVRNKESDPFFFSTRAGTRRLAP